MVSFVSLWFLLAATPLLAKSIGQSVQHSAALEKSRFLQIAHKSCRGPEGQWGTCMFNYECSQQRGQVIGACLDRFLFGACCSQAEVTLNSYANSTVVPPMHASTEWPESSTNRTVLDSASGARVEIETALANTIAGVDQHEAAASLFTTTSSSSFQRPESSSESPGEPGSELDPLAQEETTGSPEMSKVLDVKVGQPLSNQISEVYSRRPKTSTTTTSTTNHLDATSSTETSSTGSGTKKLPSLADQQANLMQFLVSNPPAWVIDEIINSSSMTTWYPLPIPENHPEPAFGAEELTTEVKELSTETPVILVSEETTSTTQEATTSTTTTEEPTTSTTSTTSKPKPAYDHTKHCGVRPLAREGRIVGGRRADYGKWPWQVLVRESTWFGIFSKNKCGGVLISDRHVLTAAHCQPGFLGSLLVVLGDFDLTATSEPNTPVERNVKRVVIHRDYVERTFENDLAILELESPVEFQPYIVPICLPKAAEGDFSNQKAIVTGWGKLTHHGVTPGVLFEVDVPIMTNTECHNMFKKAGHVKRILDSFICAGYPEGKKDSCEGDSGGPLMFERDDGRWTLGGTVSHGIRCAYPNMPGVYMRMTYYRPWIERVTGIGGIQLG